MTQLTIVGSTGSIGRNTLKVVEHLQDRFQVFALSAHSATGLLAEQVRAFHTRLVALSDESRIHEFKTRCNELGVTIPEIVLGEQGLREITSASEVDTVVSAAVGAAGLVPTYSAVLSGKKVALANK